MSNNKIEPIVTMPKKKKSKKRMVDMDEGITVETVPEIRDHVGYIATNEKAEKHVMTEARKAALKKARDEKRTKMNLKAEEKETRHRLLLETLGDLKDYLGKISNNGVPTLSLALKEPTTPAVVTEPKYIPDSVEIVEIAEKAPGFSFKKIHQKSPVKW